MKTAEATGWKDRLSEQLIEMLKLQVKTASDPQQAKDAIAILEVYGYKALPALRDLLRESEMAEVREQCREIIKKLGWLPEEE